MTFLSTIDSFNEQFGQNCCDSQTSEKVSRRNFPEEWNRRMVHKEEDWLDDQLASYS